MLADPLARILPLPCDLNPRETRMQRMIGYMVSSAASFAGWKLGALINPVVGFFVALVAAAAGLYFSRRWLKESLG